MVDDYVKFRFPKIKGPGKTPSIILKENGQLLVGSEIINAQKIICVCDEGQTFKNIAGTEYESPPR